jgi:membrane protease YdiL (CAAX protease family)
VIAFAALTVALAALWAPRVVSGTHATGWWTFPFALALLAAGAGGLVDARGFLALFLLAGACLVANRARSRAWSALAHIVVLTTTAALMLHVMPGFTNPIVLDHVVVGNGSDPYTKYLNFDKGVAGLLLLGIYTPDRTMGDEGLRHGLRVVWQFTVVSIIAIMLSLLSGYVRWDPKLPAWRPLWTWSMVFLTALPEEAVFRGLAQEWVRRRLGRSRRADGYSIVVGGMFFGLAHAAGGWIYVVLATAAGIGYGWIYATNRSIGSAILSHSALNFIHLVFFSYPSLALASSSTPVR